jgi:anti-sigma factor RsiW
MKEHVTDLLSSFLDGQLPEVDRRMVETHVEKCEACERELSELKKLTSLLARTPRAPLPTGFLERLERRRGREAAAQAERPPFFIPMPAKALAFGLSAFLVCMVGYDAWRGPGRVEDRIRELAPMSQTSGARMVGPAH